jgi:acetyl esterase/lipase
MPYRTYNFAELNWRETFVYYYTLLTTPLALAKTLVTLPLTNTHGLSTKRFILNQVFRHFLQAMGGRELQKLTGRNEDTYRAHMKKTGVEPRVEYAYSEGDKKCKILWLGKKDANRVVFYLHGGGFVAPMADVVPVFMDLIIKQVETTLGDKGISCQVAIPEYTLATQCRFPTQLQELSIALQYIINSGIDPSNIIIAGDSAGANLAYQLLQHVLEPRLAGVPPINRPPNSKFGGVWLLSPYFDLLGEKPSTKATIPLTVDIATRDFLVGCGKDTLAGLHPDDEEEGKKWLFGTLSPKGFKEKIVDRVLIYGGGQELLLDSILEFAERMKEEYGSGGASGESCEVMVAEFGTHDGPIYDPMLGTQSKETTRTLEWFCEVFGRSV